MSGDARELLDEAVVTLRDELAPGLSGEARYLTLLAANAVGTARRELSLNAAPETERCAVRRLVAAIREGRHDDDDALLAELLAEAARRAWVADPATLSATERRRFLGHAEA